MILRMYSPKRPSRSEFVPVRTARYHVQQWGTPQAGVPPIFMMHGWMDVAASFQFVVDAMKSDRRVIAADWRGFGHTESPKTDHYWFTDYLADLELLIDHYSPDAPIDLIGHSMGGNVVMMYAGVRPTRIRKLVNLEGFGLAATLPDKAPRRYADWIDGVKEFNRGNVTLKSYPTLEAVADRLMKTNRRLAADKALWLAQHWSKRTTDAQGNIQFEILGDPAHKTTNSQIYRADEAVELYKLITAPTLMIEASDDTLAGYYKNAEYTRDDFHKRLENVADYRIELIPDSGHMLHHDKPELVASLIEDFLGS